MDNIFEAVRKLPAVEVALANDVNLIQKGGRWRGLCPFHTEKTPSFFEKDGYFKCFGCGWSGDSIKLVADLHGLRPVDAAMLIAEQFGLSVYTSPSPAVNHQTSETAKIRELEKAFRNEIARVHDDLALVHRCILQGLRTLEDYSNNVILVQEQPIIEDILLMLTSKDEAEQVMAWRYAKGWVG